MSVVAVKVGVIVGVLEGVKVIDGVSVAVGLNAGVGVWLGAAKTVAVSGGRLIELTCAGVAVAQADKRKRAATDHGTSRHGRCKHR